MTPSASPANRTSIKSLGGFDLICKIGQGGMGSVFKARQVSLDRIVALKVLPPSIAQNNPVFIERFIREARTSAKLNHPNVVQGIEVGQDEATKLYYFAMEFVDGPTAKELLKQQQRLPELRALEIAYGVAQALVCAQRAGIVHRDIKPDNILITSKGDVKLADLGLARGNFDASLDMKDTGMAKSNRASTTHVDLTQSGSTIGTPSYMAPEQVRGEVDRLDVRTDLYALGATLFYMLTGMPPYVAKTAAAIMNMHLNEPVPDVRAVNPDVSEGASTLIVRLMQKDPKDRYQTADELVSDLQALLRGETQASTAGKRTPAPLNGAAASGRASMEGGRPGRGTITYAVAAFVAICAAVALLLWTRSKPEPRKQAEAPVATERVPDPVAPGGQADSTDTNVQSPSKNKELPAQPLTPAQPAESPEQIGEATRPNAGIAPKLATPAAQPELKQAPEAPVTPIVEPAKPAAPALTLERRALVSIKEALETFDLPAARAALKDFADKENLEELQRKTAELTLEAAIAPRARKMTAEIEELAAKGDIDGALERLNAVKFTEPSDEAPASPSEVVAAAMFNGVREKLLVRKALHGLNDAVKLNAELDNVLLGVSAALESNKDGQAAKWLDEAIARPEMAPLAEQLNREKELIGWFAEIRKAVEDGAGEMSDASRTYTLTTTDGHIAKVGKGAELRFVSVKDGVLNLEQHTQHVSFNRQIKLDALTRDTRYELSLLSRGDDKLERARLKVKWAYADLSSMTGASPKSLPVLDGAEKLIWEAKADGAPAEDLALMQPWLTRVQARLAPLKRSERPRPRGPFSAVLPFITVVSAGNGAGAKFQIGVNGQTLFEGGADRRGLNVVAFAGEEVVFKGTFDTSADADASRLFAGALAALPKNSIVIVAACDDASKNFNDSAYKALKSIGAKLALQGKPYRHAYYCIGTPGMEEGGAVEEMGPGLLEYPRTKQ